MSEGERKKLEVIDARIGHLLSLFKGVTELLTVLFERQMDLEELVSKQSKLLEECHEIIEAEYGNGPIILGEIAEMQREAKELLERSVK